MLFGDKIKKEINARSTNNPLWNYDSLRSAAEKTLAAYVNTVNSGSTGHLIGYVSAQYKQYIDAMLAYMSANGLTVEAKRKIWRFKIIQISPPYDENLWFIAEVGVGYDDILYEYGQKADDYAESTADNREIWQFNMENNHWLLSSRSIEPIFNGQGNAKPLKSFAAQNNYVASGFTENWFAIRGCWLTPLGNPDFLIVGDSALDPSNSNTLYQLAEVCRQETDGFEGIYLVGHTKLAKRYEKIVIIPKAHLRDGKSSAPKDRIELEWPQFNERFALYAPPTSRVSALELVNPKFMQDLYDMNSLAIVDIVEDRAVVFIKLTDGTLTEKDATQMKHILEMAEKELAF